MQTTARHMNDSPVKFADQVKRTDDGRISVSWAHFKSCSSHPLVTQGVIIQKDDVFGFNMGQGKIAGLIGRKVILID